MGHLKGTAFASATLVMGLNAVLLAQMVGGRHSSESLILSAIFTLAAGGTSFTVNFFVGAAPAMLFHAMARRQPLRHPAWPVLYGSLVGLLLGWCPAIVIVFFFEPSDAPLPVLLRDPRVLEAWFAGFVLPGTAWGVGWWRAMRQPRIDIAPTRS